MKKNILITGPYLPGKLFGGPVRSLHNMIETLGNDYNFYIITGDRDLNSNVQYERVRIGEWNQVGKAKVLYVPNGERKKHIKDVLSKKKIDIIYCSSFFAKPSIIIQLMKFTRKIKIPVIIAPRGEFSPGALGIKSFKKRIFLSLYKILKINKLVTYTCTSENDKQDIKEILGEDIDIVIAGNIVSTNKEHNKIRTKEAGYLNIATVSRISRIKNIDYSLNLLKNILDSKIDFKNINFDIYGPIEDEVYYKECLEIIKDIDTKINIKFMGPREYDEIVDILSGYHVFLFPTKGENFGHVIQEALLAGCPVIISDQTPWKDLSTCEVGYDISLDKNNIFINKLNKFIGMKNSEYDYYSDKAFEYAVKKTKEQKAIVENRAIFDKYKGINNLNS